MDYENVLLTKEEGIATMTLNRPKGLNAFNDKMLREMLSVVEDVKNDDDVKVLVITGAGRGFCSGRDVKDSPVKFDDPIEKARKYGRAIPQRLVLELTRMDKPVIASINGVAVAGGLDLALACDIRIASEKATFGELWVKRGILPGMGGTWFLPRLVGLDKACQLIWTGDIIDAKEAHRIGLVSEVVPAEKLAEATRELANKLARGPNLAIGLAKIAIYEGLGVGLASALEFAINAVGIAHSAPEHREGDIAFLEKRRPVFGGG